MTDILKGKIMELSYGEDIKLDLKDKKILAALSQNARLTPSHLADIIRLSRNAIRLRIKKLEQLDILRGSITVLNPFNTGLEAYSLLLKLENLKEDEEIEILKFLVQHPFVVWFARSSGQWDFIIYLFAKNSRHLDLLIAELKEKCFNRIINIERLTLFSIEKYFLISDAFSKNLDIRLKFDKKDSSYGKFLKKPIVNTDFKIQAIDEKDIKILYLLAENATLSITEIAKKINLSPDAVDYRIINLIKKNIILAFLPVINASYLHYHVYLLFLELRSNITEKRKDEFLNFCKNHNDVAFILQTSGKWHINLYMTITDPLHFFHTLNEFRNKFHDVIQSYESLLIIKDYKFNFFPHGLLQIKKE